PSDDRAIPPAGLTAALNRGRSARAAAHGGRTAAHLRRAMVGALLALACSVSASLPVPAQARETACPLNPARGLHHVSLGKGLWRIDDPVLGNVYLIEGGFWAMVVHAGIGDPDLYVYASSLTGKPLLAVNTHIYPEHIGLDDPDDPAALAERRDADPAEQGAAAQREPGAPGLVDPQVPMRPRAPYRPPARMLELQHDGRQNLGGREVRFFHVPADRPIGLVVYDSRTATLMTGSAANSRQWLPAPEVRSVQDILDGMGELIALPHPVRRLLPSRGGPLPPAHLQRLEQAAQALHAGQIGRASCRARVWAAEDG